MGGFAASSALSETWILAVFGSVSFLASCCYIPSLFKLARVGFRG